MEWVSPVYCVFVHVPWVKVFTLLPPRASPYLPSLFSPPFIESRTAATSPLPSYQATASRLTSFTCVLERQQEVSLMCALAYIHNYKWNIVPSLSTIRNNRGLHFLAGWVLITDYISPYTQLRKQQSDTFSNSEHFINTELTFSQWGVTPQSGISNQLPQFHSHFSSYLK